MTANLKDFPETILECLGLEAIHPDSFIVAQWDLDSIATIRAFKQMRARWRCPSASAHDFADRFELGSLPLTANRLREVAELI